MEVDKGPILLNAALRRGHSLLTWKVRWGWISTQIQFIIESPIWAGGDAPPGFFRRQFPQVYAELIDLNGILLCFALPPTLTSNPYPKRRSGLIPASYWMCHTETVQNTTKNDSNKQIKQSVFVPQQLLKTFACFCWKPFNESVRVKLNNNELTDASNILKSSRQRQIQVIIFSFDSYFWLLCMLVLFQWLLLWLSVLF